ncbi:MAG: hypothetical protein K0Q87_176 [Neobacillus sp.]|jgi:hypothetical protein|nr:hypothetical protein [Neobacillus sp.]
MTDVKVQLLLVALKEIDKIEKRETQILELLGGEEKKYQFREIRTSLEQSLVLALGGTIGNWNYLGSLFEDPFYQFSEGKLSAENLIKEIQEAILNKLEGEIEINFHKADLC